MSTQTASHSPEFQALIEQVETALVQSAADARELAERTGTPLIVRDTPKNQPSKLELIMQETVQSQVTI